MYAFLCITVYVHGFIEKMTPSYVFVFASKPSQTRAARTWSTWTSRLSWSQRTVSHSQSSWWPPRGRRSLHGPVTSARHVNTHQSPAARRESRGFRQKDCALQNSLTFPLSFLFISTTSVLQCIDNIRCNGLMMNAFEDNSKVTVPQMIK